jgi:hypothetical protein
MIFIIYRNLCEYDDDTKSDISGLNKGFQIKML